MLKNREVAEAFENIANMLEILEENRFKIRAYRNASRNIGELTERIEEVAARGGLTEISGVGAELARKIEGFLATGVIDEYERLKKKVPEECLELLNIQGLGPKTLALFYRELGIRNLKDLEAAIKRDDISALPRMGDKKVEEIKRGIKHLKEGFGRMPLGVALPIAEEIASLVGAIDGVLDTLIAGSLRRRRETVRDIDVLAMSEDGPRVVEVFTKLPFVKETLLAGDTKGSVLMGNGKQIDLRAIPPDSWGGAMQYFTGSKAHNVKMRMAAIKQGLNLNEYGLFRGEDKIAGKSEEEIYETLGLAWIPPELREDRGEIEAARKGSLPVLVAEGDIRGDLHSHSTWSDGKSSIEDMVLAAKKMGYEYIAVTDHSPSSNIAHGLTVERLNEKRKELEAVKKRAKGITVLMGAEVDIKSDGTLDYPDDVLRGLDIVLAAVHSGFKMERERMTKRVVTALRNPYVHALVHPTGRLIGTRPAYELDMDEVMRTAACMGKALEVNSHHLRLDLNDVNVRKAVGMGIKVIISTDAHSTEGLRMMRYGVGTARRGWAGREDVVNTMTAPELKKWLKSVRNTA